MNSRIKQYLTQELGIGQMKWSIRFLLLFMWLIGCPLAFFISWIKLGICIIGGSPIGLPLIRSYDRLGNVCIGGSEHETISSRAGRLQASTKWACILCKILNKIEKDHCTKSIGV